MTSKYKFLQAANDGNIRTIKQYIKEGGDINVVDDYSNCGWTALTYASYYNHIEVVEYLIQNKADLSIKNKFGKIALKIASEQNNFEVVKILSDFNEYQLRKKLDIKNASDVIKDSCIF